MNTAWKVSKYGVISGPYFPAFGLATERYQVYLCIQSKCGKIRTRNNSVFGISSRSGSCVLIRNGHHVILRMFVRHIAFVISKGGEPVSWNYVSIRNIYTWFFACLFVILFFLKSLFLLFCVPLVKFWKSFWCWISALIIQVLNCDGAVFDIYLDQKFQLPHRCYNCESLAFKVVT